MPMLRLSGHTQRKLWKSGGARSYNFAATQYAKCFDREGMPITDQASNDSFVKKLRVDTIDFLDNHKPASWASDPSMTPGEGAVVTQLNGKILSGGSLEDTVDAFERKNGKVVQATSEQVDEVIAHMASYTPKKDYRAEVRAMEAEIFDVFGGSPWPSFLVGNQALDFQKQDGVTEIEESVQANLVEQRMNDALLADEISGKIEIKRAPAYVGCVSNFSNFLDLCRKSLRNLELGVPIVVLSRSNTTQHMYRWTQMLTHLSPKYGIDPGMVTYLAAPRREKQRVFSSASSDCPMYFTCSREVAKDLRSFHGPVMSSTGGPNTLVATKLTPEVEAAIKLSATIENSGQCTALRHAVVPSTSADIEKLLSNVPVLTGPADALRKGEFAGVFDFASNVMERVDGYTLHKQNDNIAYRVSSELPPDDIDEQWRNVYVDVTSPVKVNDASFINSLSRWLVQHQPITLAINAEGGDFTLAQGLFEQTGQVVYTVGTVTNPALTCQARPQDGEVFGEFPVRRELKEMTKYPVVVPTPTPAYNSTYSDAYLSTQGQDWDHANSSLPAEAAAVAGAVANHSVRGYIREISEYLSDALACNPKQSAKGTGRTALFGLQTTPLNGQLNFIRCGESATMEDLAPHLFPYIVTSAYDQLRLSVDPRNTALTSALSAAGIGAGSSGGATTVEDSTAFDGRVDVETPYNVLNINGPMPEFPLVGQWCSLLFCVGHIKSNQTDHQEFVDAFKPSPKWLKSRH